MTQKNALDILGIEPGDTEEDIKKKYRRLMLIHHPDSVGRLADIEVSKKINEAYRVVKEEGNLLQDGSKETQWSAKKNSEAFRRRSVYVDYSFLDKRIPVMEVAFGKYLWDPYIEDFKMLARSIAKVTGELADEYVINGSDADLFHLLMQEYIDPIFCAKRAVGVEISGDIYSFVGEVGIDGSDKLHYLRENDVALRYRSNGNHIELYDDEIGDIGRLSYNDDSYYYIVNPILELYGDSTEINIRAGMLHTARGDLNYMGKLDVKIDIKIPENVVGKPADNRIKIRDLLGI